MMTNPLIMFPRTINKKTLCFALGLKDKKGRAQYIKLRSFYLTDSILEKCGIDPDKYKSIWLFDVEQTDKLITEFDLALSDFENIEPIQEENKINDQ